tara:strand:+ start:301 stop:495 length:195 start_codon:yes stop_codon:yes gene_type:complete
MNQTETEKNEMVRRKIYYETGIRREEYSKLNKDKRFLEDEQLQRMKQLRREVKDLRKQLENDKK